MLDKRFFDAKPRRRFLARPYAAGDTPFPLSVPIYNYEPGLIRQIPINLVIVKNCDGRRRRLLFGLFNYPELKTDRAIVKFLAIQCIHPSWIRFFD